MLLNLGIVPTENQSKITPICRSHADDYIVIVVKDFNSKYAVLIFFHLYFCCNCISQNSPKTCLNALEIRKIMTKFNCNIFFLDVGKMASDFL